MKNYILIISILTIIVVFIVIYLNDYIKGVYFNNCVEDFQDAVSIISNAGIRSSHENFENSQDVRSEYQKRIDAIKFENNKDIKSEYQKRVEALRADFYEKNSPRASTGSASATTAGSATMLEESLSAQSDFYQNGLLDKYSTITDPIGDEYLPYTVKNYKDDPVAITKNNMNEYTIINVYKNILDRQPTDKELRKNLQDFYENDIDEGILKLRIYNSSEYKIITNMQSNDIKPELITNISKGQLKDKLKQFYKDQFNTIITNTKLIDILIKCYIHLQFNDYLFKAMLMHDKYMAFENRLKMEVILSDEKILYIFNRNFILYELRLIANELKRQDIIKRKAFQTPIALYNNNKSELSTSNVNMGAGKQISDIVKNSDNIFNINIMVKDPDTKTSMPFSRNNQNRQGNQGNRTSSGSSSFRVGSGAGSGNSSGAGSFRVGSGTASGTSGTSGTSGASRTSGTSGAGSFRVGSGTASGTSGTSGTSGATGASGAGSFRVGSGTASGTSGAASGTSGASGAASGTSGTAGVGSGTASGASGAASGTSGAASGSSGGTINVANMISNTATNAASAAGATSAVGAAGGGGAVNAMNAVGGGGAANSASAAASIAAAVAANAVNSAGSAGASAAGASAAGGSAAGGSAGASDSVYDQRYNEYKDQYYKQFDTQNNNTQYDDTQYDDTQYDDTQSDDPQFPTRIYNPIDYKSHYRGDMGNRPNVCSYGTKQIVQPIFLNSSTLFQGTDLKEAEENTQVGSIMPKFEYYEYEDTR